MSTGCRDALARSLTSQPTGSDVIPVHPRDRFQLDPFRTHRFTLADVGAASEILLIELAYHAERTFVPLGLALRQ